MTAAMSEYGNPSSIYALGRTAKNLMEHARQQTAELINADIKEIIFTGSGTEANTTVFSICELSGGTEIITSSIEHPCILGPAEYLETKGAKVTYLNVDQYGKIDTGQLRNTLSNKTKLVSIMMANNEIGTIQDIKTIADIAHRHGALFHTDAIQAVGKIPIDVKKLDVDYLTISGHKLYGPKGIGALYVKDGAPFAPLLRGGHQEQEKRAGTENIPGIIGMGKAIEMRKLEMADEHKKLLQLKTALKNGITAKIPDIQFNGHPTDCLAGTLNVSFAGAEGESILLYLDIEGIAVSTGSACASGSLDPSHVLLATGLPAEYAHGSIRISPGRETSMADIEYMLDVLPKIIEKIRNMSSVYKRRNL